MRKIDIVNRETKANPETGKESTLGAILFL